MSEWVADIERIADEIHNAYEEGYADGKRDAVVHGHWEMHEDTYGDDEAKCSVCGFEMAVNQPGNGLCMVSELNYCSHCGAKMDEVTES